MPPSLLARKRRLLQEVELLKKRVVILTDAQIKALPTTGAEIIPALGAGKMALINSVVIDKNFTAGVYTNLSESGKQLYLVTDIASAFNNASNALADGQVQGIFANANRRVAIFSEFSAYDTAQTIIRGTAGTSNTDLANKPVGLWMDNAAGALTGGNAANTMTVTVFYLVVNLS